MHAFFIFSFSDLDWLAVESICLNSVKLAIIQVLNTITGFFIASHPAFLEKNLNKQYSGIIEKQRKRS